MVNRTEQVSLELPCYASRDDRPPFSSIKSKLLKLVKRNIDVKIRHCDRTTKVKMNRHPDNEWYIKPLIIKEGDKVLVKQDEPRKKNNKPYSTTP